VKIYASETHVDLEAPINMSEIQQEKFIEFMEIICPDISVINVREISKKKPVKDEPPNPKKWTVDDYFAILGAESNNELENKLGRTEMSVKMKRGTFVPDFYYWINSKGYIAPITKEMVEEFLNERREFE
jgi:hypothetical protein